MDKYIILVGGPASSKNMLFAQELAEMLGSARAIACTELAKQSNTEQKLLSLLDDSLAYHIVYGENVLAHDLLQKLSSLSLYVDADDVDVMTNALNGYDKSGKTKNRQSRSLSEEIEAIVKQNQERLEKEVVTTKPKAQIVIEANEELRDGAYSVFLYIQRTDQRLANQRLSEEERKKRVDAMLRRYGHALYQSRKAKIKKALWHFVIKSTLVFKRLMDIAISLTALLLLSPLFLVVALCIKLTDGGPVIYVQKRIGKQGKEFDFPKFRSMVLNADKMKDNLLDMAERKGDVTFKMKRDPRVTRIGRFIRRFSIDELPQLWCVLKGQMSIVGPRPPVPREVALYTQEDRRRLEVTPGLTGIWQVSGRSDIGFKQQVELDVLYIESHGFLLDIKLLLKTIPAVLSGRGAY